MLSTDESSAVNTAAPTDFEKWEADEVAGTAEVKGAESEAPGDDEGEADEAEDDVAVEGEAAEGDDAEEETEDKPAKKSRGLEKRFAELTSEIRELKSKLEAKPAPDEKAVEAKPAKKPVLADFDDYESYNDALMEFKFREKDAATAASNQAKTVVEGYLKRAKDFSATHPDFEKVTAQDVPISPAIHDFIVSDEQGPDMAYYLAKRPKELARIMALPLNRHAYELGRVAATLEKPKEDKAGVTKAPKPVQPVGRASNAAGPDAEPNPKDYSIWDAWFERQEKRKRKTNI